LKFLSYHHIWHDVRYHVKLIKKIEAEEKQSKTPNGENKAKDKIENNSDAQLSKDRLSNKLNIPQSLLEEVLMYPNNVNLNNVIVFC